MLHEPKPILNAAEITLLDEAPEECLRRAVARGAFAVNSLVANLPPRIATAVAAIAAGERPVLPPPGTPTEEETSGREASIRRVNVLPRDEGRRGRVVRAQQAPEWTLEAVRDALQPFPQLAQVLGAGMMSPDEAMEAAHAIDGVLGRYATGTRYAAP